METKYEIVKEDDTFVYGKTYTRKGPEDAWAFSTDYMVYKSEKRASQIAEETKKSLETVRENLKINEEQQLKIHKEIANLIIGPLAFIKKEQNKEYLEIINPEHLFQFAFYKITEKFPSSFSKDIFSALLDANKSDDRYLTGQEVLEKILENPRFKSADSSAIDKIIDEVILANPENAAKVSTQPKVLQWFVGQVMKASKGTAPANIVLEKLSQRLS